MAHNSSSPDGKLRRSHRWVWQLAVRLMKPVWARKYQYEYDPVTLDGPYLLIANHGANSDPITVGLANPARPPAFVGSEHLDRLGPVTRLLRWAFALIPRSKASSGMQTVKRILRVLQQGQPVVLFAEGECTWDGVSADIFPATGKLAKLARVPLVTYRLEGNYLTRPRWAKKPRKGPLRGRLVHIYTPEELAGMDAEAVNAAINRDLYWDAPSSAEQSGAVYRGKAPAAGLERALFLCPACGGLGCLKTKGDEILCTACGKRARLNAHGTFDSGPYPTVRAWDLWQKRAFGRLVRAGRQAGLFPCRGTWTELPDGRPRRAEFSLDLKEQAIRIGETALPFAAISDAAMVKTNRLLLTADGKYYEIRADRAILRPYLLAIQPSQTKAEVS